MLERLDPAELGKDIAPVRIRPIAALPDEGGGARAAQELEDLGRGVVAMERRAAHVAVARAGEQRHHALDPARQPDRDALTGLEAARRKVRGERIGGIAQAGIIDAPEAVA